MRAAAAQIEIKETSRYRYEGQRQGYATLGVFSYPDGWRYEGRWRSDLFTADSGVATDAYDRTQGGRWKDGRFLGSSSTSNPRFR